MTTRHTVHLDGCSATPLANYLKALGIFRLVAEQVDPETTAWWEGETLTINSMLNPQDLSMFFFSGYQPTPILAPWNAGCGFYLKWDEGKRSFKTRKAAEALQKIANSSSPAFEPYKRQIAITKLALEKSAHEVDMALELESVRDLILKRGGTKKESNSAVKEFIDSSMLFEVHGKQLRISKANKDDFLLLLRGHILDDEVLQWLDTALVLQSGTDKVRMEAPLLGSGGNIGNSDFSARFMQMLAEVLPTDLITSLPPSSKAFLSAALFGELSQELLHTAVDQFDPGRSGGKNMLTGFDADPLLNPWDYIFMMEGAMVISGSATKRLGSTGTFSAFPFSVRSTVAGFASGAPENTRGEIWLPLWNKPCNLYELKAFIAEGRSTIEGRSVKDGIDFARAVASLGIDRGIQSFVRMQFQERLGGNYLATFLGVIPVAYNRTSLLLNDFDRWRSQLRNACSAKKPNPPVSVLRAVNTLENAIFAYCRSGTKKELTGILSSVGQCVRRLASSPSFACEPKHNLRPLPRLSLQWIDEADDGSPEFRLACALASIQKSGDGEHSVGPLSSNMVPYNHHNPQAPFDKVWMEKPHIVWSNGSLISNLIAVLRRRCMDAARFGLPILPLEGACPAPLSDVISFVGGQLDEERIESFLWGLNAVDWRNWNRRNAQYSRVVDGILPPAYALLKLTHATYLPDGRLISKTNPALPFDPGIVAAAAAGRCAEATRRAARRLRASGWTPLITTIGGDSEHVRRCAAAAMFPLCSTDLRTLSRVVLRGDSEKHETISVKTDQ